MASDFLPRLDDTVVSYYYLSTILSRLAPSLGAALTQKIIAMVSDDESPPPAAPSLPAPPSPPVAPPPPPPSSSSSSSFRPTWQLPPGIEDHVEAFVMKSVLGGGIGAAAGALLRAGAGTGAAFGIGLAAGSFVERGILHNDSAYHGGRVDPAVPKFEIPDVFSRWTGSNGA